MKTRNKEEVLYQELAIPSEKSFHRKWNLDIQECKWKYTAKKFQEKSSNMDLMMRELQCSQEEEAAVWSHRDF